MSELKKTTFEKINDLLKTILWPFIVIGILLVYNVELGKIISLIPQKLESSSKISVGSFSFEIEKTAKKYGNDQLAQSITKLSEKGIIKLLTLGSGRHSIMVRGEEFENDSKIETFSLPFDYEALLELEAQKLLEADEPMEDFASFFMGLNPDRKKVFVSPDGSRTYRQNESDEEKTKYTISVSKLNQREVERIDRMGVKLSKTGKEAFEIIVQVVGQQINEN